MLRHIPIGSRKRGRNFGGATIVILHLVRKLDANYALLWFVLLQCAPRLGGKGAVQHSGRSTDHRSDLVMGHGKANANFSLSFPIQKVNSKFNNSTCIQLVLIKLTCTMNGKDLHFNLWKKMGDSGLKALVLISLNPGVFPRLSIAEFNQSHARANPKRNKPYCLCLSSSCVWQDFDSLEEHDNTTSIIYLKHYSSLHYA